MIAAPLLLGTAAALLQAGVLPAFYLDAWAAPLLPAALVAAWAATRPPAETGMIALAAALTLGAMSVERAGWFLLALLPSVGIAMLLATVAPRHQGFGARAARATATAFGGTVCYVAMLAIVSGRGATAAEASVEVAVASLGTAVLAAAGVIALAPLRRRSSGLYA